MARDWTKLRVPLLPDKSVLSAVIQNSLIEQGLVIAGKKEFEAPHRIAGHRRHSQAGDYAGAREVSTVEPVVTNNVSELDIIV